MNNTQHLENLVKNQPVIQVSDGLLVTIVYYVIFVLLAGGVLIALGIFTRLSSAMEIPIFFGAVFFTGIFRDPVHTLAWPSIVALVLLFLLTIAGSGPLSLYRYLSERE